MGIYHASSANRESLMIESRRVCECCAQARFESSTLTIFAAVVVLDFAREDADELLEMFMNNAHIMDVATRPMLLVRDANLLNAFVIVLFTQLGMRSVSFRYAFCVDTH